MGLRNFDFLHAPKAKDGAKFDYRVVAKRHGYEDIRLKPEPLAYSDHFLYPDLKDVPQKYRIEWVENLPPGEEGDTNVLNQLTPEQLKLLSSEQIEKLEAKTNPAASTTDNSNDK